jgi:biotin operon repressor
MNIKILKSLADKSRIMIVNCLMDRPGYVQKLADQLDLAESTVSFHIKKLENAGLIYSKKEQYYTNYYLKKDIFKKTLEELIKIDKKDLVCQQDREQKYKDKVINTFFKDSKLLKIPVQRKKRRIILEKLALLFERDRHYPEKEVNLKIADFHDDFCTIRREMICEGIMNRANGEYWLI